MADINKVVLTDLADSQLATWQRGFELSSYDNGTSIVLKAGFVEYLGGYPYRVESGDLTVTGSPSDGAVYLYISEDGDDTASATLSNTAPTYDVVKGSFYNGTSKAIFVFTKSGSNYNDRYRMTDVNKDLGCQLGQIIDIHPEVIKKPNAYNFALCNNTVALPASNFTLATDSNAPDLTSKFIQGGTSHGTGGANTTNLQHNHSHSHTVDSHNHGIKNATSFGAGGGSDIYATPFASGTSSDDTSPGTSTDSTNALSSTYDNRPAYFQCLKYMRIR